jgi:long-chain acyl-CoA synthetase
MTVPPSTSSETAKTSAAMTVDGANRQLTGPGGPFEMEEAEVRGVQLRTWKRTPASLRSILESTRAFADRPYLVYDGERLDYGRHYQKVAALAGVLADRFAVAKGDRVAIAMRNFPEWIVAFWAATAIGAIAVPLNAWWTGEELAYGLGHSGARVLIADRDRLDRLASHRDGLALDHIVLARSGGEVPAGVLDLDELIAGAAAAAALPDVIITPEDTATIFYTSGTTGRPKGAIGTHRNICSNPISVAFIRARADLRQGLAPTQDSAGAPKRVALLTVPLFHVTGCHSALVSSTIAGDALVMMHRWDAEKALELIETEKVTSVAGVPAMAWQILESPDLGRRDLSSIKTFGYGGAPAAPELVRRLRSVFPDIAPRNGYGLTETSSVAVMNIAGDYVARPDSIGLPPAVCDIRIADGEGTDVAPGAVGELWFKGPNVVAGYWNDPDASAAAIVDGWLRTGDLVRADQDGFLYAVDRAKDMLIRGGENVYCVEVENVLYEHPAVMDAAVIGLPHRVLGEEVGAVVQAAPGAAPAARELMDHVARHLAAFKVPVRIEVRDTPLPRNANGKVLKQRLKDEFRA